MKFFQLLLCLLLIFSFVVHAEITGCVDFGKQADEFKQATESGSVVTITENEVASAVTPADLSEFNSDVRTELQSSGLGDMAIGDTSQDIGISGADLAKSLRLMGTIPTLNYDDYSAYCPDPSDGTNYYCSFDQTGYIYNTNYNLSEVYADSIRSQENQAISILPKTTPKWTQVASTMPSWTSSTSQPITMTTGGNMTAAVITDNPMVFGVQLPSPLSACEVTMDDTSDSTTTSSDSSSGTLAGDDSASVKLSFESASTPIKFYKVGSSLAPNDDARNNLYTYKERSFTDADLWTRALVRMAGFYSPNILNPSRASLLGKFISWRKSTGMTSTAALAAVEENLTKTFGSYSKDFPGLMNLLRKDYERARILSKLVKETDPAKRATLLQQYSAKCQEIKGLSGATGSAVTGKAISVNPGLPGVSVVDSKTRKAVASSFTEEVQTTFRKANNLVSAELVKQGETRSFGQLMLDGAYTASTAPKLEPAMAAVQPQLATTVSEEAAGAAFIKGTTYGKTGLQTLANNYAAAEGAIEYLTKIQTSLKSKQNSWALNAEKKNVIARLKSLGFEVTETASTAVGGVPTLTLKTPRGATGLIGTSAVTTAMEAEKREITRLMGLEFKTTIKDTVKAGLKKAAPIGETLITAVPKLSAIADKSLLGKSVGLFAAKKAAGSAIKLFFSWPAELIISTIVIGKSLQCNSIGIEYPELSTATSTANPFLGVDADKPNSNGVLNLVSSSSFSVKPEKNIGAYKKCMSSIWVSVLKWISIGGIFADLQDPYSSDDKAGVINRVVVYSDDQAVTCTMPDHGSPSPYIQKNLSSGKLVDPFLASYEIKCTNVTRPTKFIAFQDFKPTPGFMAFLTQNQSRITNKNVIDKQISEQDYKQMLSAGFLDSVGKAEFSKGTVNLTNVDKLLIADGFLYKTKVLAYDPKTGQVTTSERDSLIISSDKSFLDLFKDFSGKTDLTESTLTSAITFTDCSTNKIPADISISGSKMTINVNQGAIKVGNSYCINVMLQSKANSAIKGKMFQISNIQEAK
jgi:hypothetical protein